MGKWFFILIAAGWIVQAVAGQIAKKKEEERLKSQAQSKREMARQRVQTARSEGIKGLVQGTPPTAQSATGRRKAQLQELRQRREQQLEELRRRKQMQQRPAAQARAIPTQQQPPTLGQIPQQPSLARQTRGLSSRPQQAPQPLPSVKAQTTQHSTLHSFEDERPSKQKRKKAKPLPSKGRLLIDRPSELVQRTIAPTISLSSMLRDSRSLRQAFILKELLEPPVSLRETESIC